MAPFSRQTLPRPTNNLTPLPSDDTAQAEQSEHEAEHLPRSSLEVFVAPPAGEHLGVGAGIGGGIAG